MNDSTQSGSSAKHPGRVSAIRSRFLGDRGGSTAVEFAMIAFPFLLFVFGIFGIGLQYLATNSLDRAVFAASRAVRTGIAQKSEMTADEFKTMLCQEAAPHINCNKLQLHIQNEDSWEDIQPVNCIDGSGHLASGGNGSDKIGDRAGGASKIVMVTACYNWEASLAIPYYVKDREGNLRSPATKVDGGGLLLQSSVVFRTEPYE